MWIQVFGKNTKTLNTDHIREIDLDSNNSIYVEWSNGDYFSIKFDSKESCERECERIKHILGFYPKIEPNVPQRNATPPTKQKNGCDRCGYLDVCPSTAPGICGQYTDKEE